MNSLSNTIGLVLAGGVGSRLSPLTDERAKPAVPFGGRYRIIDFTLSNCINSGLRQLLVLTQYKSQSLQTHLLDTWSFLSPQMGEYVTAVPPQMRTGQSWYEGTADAVFQNLYLLERSTPENVLILSGDHIYNMDYSAMIWQHEASAADVTVACMEVDIRDARRFGVMSLDAVQQVRGFDEKPNRPTPVPGHSRRAIVSMGVYVFSADLLRNALVADHNDSTSSHDFGRDLIPRLIQTHRVFGYRFSGDSGNAGQGYWRDVGTVDSYYQANMDLLMSPASLNIYSKNWPIRASDTANPPAHVGVDAHGNHAEFYNSILSNGVVVDGGRVCDSILSAGVRIGGDTDIRRSILFDDVVVEQGARLRNCIVDKGVRIPTGVQIGFDPDVDAGHFALSKGGVVVIPKGFNFSSIRRHASTGKNTRPTSVPALETAHVD